MCPFSSVIGVLHFGQVMGSRGNSILPLIGISRSGTIARVVSANQQGELYHATSNATEIHAGRRHCRGRLRSEGRPAKFSTKSLCHRRELRKNARRQDLWIQHSRL